MNKIKDKSAKEEYFYCDLPEEKEEKGKIPFTVKAILFLFSGMGFACFEGFGGMSPFALSFMSAVPYSFCLPCFIGSTLGYFITVKDGSLLKYIGASMLVCLFRVIMKKRFSDRDSSFINCIISFCSLFLSGIIYLWFDEVALLPLLTLVGESLFSLFASCLFVKAFNLPFYKGSLSTFS